MCVYVEDPGVNAAIKPLIRVYCFSCKSSTIPRFPEFAKALKDRIKPGRTKQEAVYIYKHLLIDHGYRSQCLSGGADPTSAGGLQELAASGL